MNVFVVVLLLILLILLALTCYLLRSVPTRSIRLYYDPLESENTVTASSASENHSLLQKSYVLRRSSTDKAVGRLDMITSLSGEPGKNATAVYTYVITLYGLESEVEQYSVSTVIDTAFTYGSQIGETVTYTYHLTPVMGPGRFRTWRYELPSEHGVPQRRWLTLSER